MMASTAGSRSAMERLRCVSRAPRLRLGLGVEAGAEVSCGGGRGEVRVRSITGRIRGEGSKDLGSSRGSDVRITVLSLLMPMPEAAQKRSIAGIAELNNAGRQAELEVRSSAAARGWRSGQDLRARMSGS